MPKKTETTANFKIKLLLLAIPLLSSSSIFSAYASALPNIENNMTSARPQEKAKKNNDRYLFVQSAHKASIQIKDKAAGTYTITLHDIPGYVTAFTERPSKKTEAISIEKFLNLWANNSKESFKHKPPNVDINGVIESSNTEDPINFLVELTEPLYNSQEKTLTYTMKALTGNVNSLPESANLNHVNLFVDDTCLSCWWP